MISFLRGRVAAHGDDWVDIDVGGIGFHAALSSHTARRLPPPGAEVNLPTHLAVREDGPALFAFSDEEERQAFRALAAVSGVGGRTALALLSALRPPELAAAVEAGDIAALIRAQGVGRKTAQRLVLELKGRLVGGLPAPARPVAAGLAGPQADARAALLALGYSEAEAAAALAAVGEEAGDTAAMVRAALRRLPAGS